MTDDQGTPGSSVDPKDEEIERLTRALHDATNQSMGLLYQAEADALDLRAENRRLKAEVELLEEENRELRGFKTSLLDRVKMLLARRGNTNSTEPSAEG